MCFLKIYLAIIFKILFKYEKIVNEKFVHIFLYV